MYTSICTVLFINYLLISHLSCSVSVDVVHNAEPTSNIRIQKNSTIINCGLGDIIKISLPLYGDVHEEYYLHRPTGEIAFFKYVEKCRNITAKKAINVLSKDDDLEISLLNSEIDMESALNDKSKDVLFLGPLITDDHGNWILSKFYNNSEGDIVEEFRTISVLIIQQIPQLAPFKSVSVGNNFYLNFPYPLPNLGSCQLITPGSTVDRDYRGDPEKTDYCGFVVENVTEEDIGIWGIIAVGKIIYITKIELAVELPDFSTDTSDVY